MDGKSKGSQNFYAFFLGSVHTNKDML